MEITLENAVKIIEKAYPKCRILRCYDYGDVYGFDTVVRSWNGDIKHRPAGGTLADTVRKSDGKIGCLHATDDDIPDNLGELNILPYLSDSDRQFAIETKHKYDNKAS